MSIRYGPAARLWRLLHPGANPLARRHDRIEAVVLLVVLLGVLAAVPFAAMAGSSTYQAQQAEVAREQATRHPATATLVADAPPPVPATESSTTATGPAGVPASWTGTDGVRHTGLIDAPTGTKAGTRLPIWIDGTGKPVAPPVAPGDATTSAVILGMFVWLVLIGALSLAYWAARWVLDHFRGLLWEREWTRISTHWTHY